MKPNLSWRTLMETRFERRTKIKTPTLVAVVVGLHVVAVGSIIFIQGCETAGRRQPVEPPPAVVMPQPDVQERPQVHRPPVVQPPVTPARRPETTPPPAAAAQTYTVRRGDSLSVIARQHGVSMATLMDLNNLSNPDLIRVDQVLLLPPDARGRTEPAPSRPAAAARPTPAAGDGTYIVKPGDTLSEIARSHRVSQRELMRANNINDPDVIRAGVSLVIPGGSAPARTESPAPAQRAPRSEPAAAPARAPERQETPVAPEASAIVPPAPAAATPSVEPFLYTVRANDSIAGLARDFGVLEEDILRMNNLQPGATLRPGQTLEIPGF